jgi:hypothetical protein
LTTEEKVFIMTPCIATRKRAKETRTLIRGVDMAAEETIISWNFANWFTILTMAALGFALIGFGVKVYQKRSGQAAAA